jgi:hypothetical protein
LEPAPKIVRPYDDFAQLQIYTMHTVAEQLKQFPELSPADGHMNGTVSWETQRAKEIDAADPEVLIIGGGQK